MISYIIQVSVCWALFYMAYLLFYKKETFFKYNRIYLILGLLGGLLIPFFEIPIALNSDSSLVVEQFMYPIQTGALKMEEYVNYRSSPIFIWKDIFIAIYLLGFLFFSRRFVIGLLEIRRLFIGAQKTYYPNYTLASTQHEHLPFTFFNILFWSKKVEMKGLDNKIFNHEMAHIRQWHSLDIIFVEFLSILFWFNPLLLVYKKALRDTHEYLADLVVTSQQDKKEYGRFLVESKVSGLQLSLANHFIQSQLKNRINMIFKSPSHQKSMWKYLFIVPMIALIAGLYAFKYSPDSETKVNTPIQEINLEKDTTLMVVIFPVGIHANGNTERIALSHNQKTYFFDEIHVMNNKSIGYSFHETVDQRDEAIAQFNTDDIESVSILKGDSFRKKYPDRAGSQAIIITLKNSVNPHLKTGEISKINIPREEIFKVVEEMPRFPGCEDEAIENVKDCAQEKMLTYIYQNIRYPLAAKDAGIQGSVIVRFVVEKDGSLSNFEILRDPGAGCGAEALRVLKSMNEMDEKWRPGYQRGQAVRVQFSMPIKYKLSDGLREKVSEQTLIEINFADGKKTQIISQGQIDDIFKEENGVFSFPQNSRLNIHKKDISSVDILKGEAFQKHFPDAKMTNKAIILHVSTTQKELKSGPQEIFKVVEEMPRFPGCEDQSLNTDELKQCSQGKLIEFIYNNLKYPKAARDEGIQGMVVVKFIIEKDGTLSGIEALRDIGAGCGTEALRVIHLMNEQGLKWNPGIQRGQAVRVQFNLPVKFKLEGSDKVNSPPKIKPTNAEVSFEENKETIKLLNATQLTSFSLSPNPNRGKFQLKFKTELDNPKVQIFNLAGTVVNEKGLTGKVGDLIQTTVDMQNVSRGSFILNIPGKNRSYNHKFIIK